MSWMKIDTGLPYHPKVYRLSAELLKRDGWLEELGRRPEDRLVGALIRLWGWAHRSVNSSGDTSPYPDRVIAREAGFPEDLAPDWVEALMSSGFLDEDRKLHNWAERSGAYAREKERSRWEHRARSRAAPEAERVKTTQESSRSSRGVPPEHRRSTEEAPSVDIEVDVELKEQREDAPPVGGVSGKKAPKATYTPATAFAEGTSGRSWLESKFPNLHLAAIDRAIAEADRRFRLESEPATYTRVQNYVRRWIANDIVASERRVSSGRPSAPEGKYAGVGGGEQ